MDYEKIRQRQIKNVVRACFSWIAAGGIPHDSDLIEYGLPRNEWRQVRAAARHILALKREGENGQARRMAGEFAAELAGRLIETDFEPREWGRSNEPTEPRELAAQVLGESSPFTDETDPRKLAAKVPRI